MRSLYGLTAFMQSSAPGICRKEYQNFKHCLVSLKRDKQRVDMWLVCLRGVHDVLSFEQGIII